MKLNDLIIRAGLRLALSSLSSIGEYYYNHPKRLCYIQWLITNSSTCQHYQCLTCPLILSKDIVFKCE